MLYKGLGKFMDVNKYLIYSTKILFFALLPQLAFSTSFGKVFNYEKLIDESPYIAHLQITGGNTLVGGLPGCGFNYSAKLTESWGFLDNKQIEFFSTSKIRVGGEYLILLTDKPFPRLLKSDSLVDQCILKSPVLKAYGGHGFPIEFVDNNIAGVGKRLVFDPLKLSFPAEINLIKQAIPIVSENSTDLESVTYHINWKQLKELVAKKRAHTELSTRSKGSPISRFESTVRTKP